MAPAFLLSYVRALGRVFVFIPSGTVEKMDYSVCLCKQLFYGWNNDLDSK